MNDWQYTATEIAGAMGISVATVQAAACKIFGGGAKAFSIDQVQKIKRCIEDEQERISALYEAIKGEINDEVLSEGLSYEKADA